MLRDGHRMTPRSIAESACADERLEGVGVEKRDQLSAAAVGDELTASDQRSDTARRESEDSRGFVQIDEPSHGHSRS
ncbi:MAG: hypothetical protein R3B99_20925 [Polyangiales bacterium]